MHKAKTAAEEEFESGVQYLHNGYYGKALDKLKAAVELDKKNPLYVSYLGVLVGLAQKKHEEAAQLCHTALQMNRHLVEGYVNLAQVYLKAGKKADAVEALEVGLQYTKRDVRLVRELRQLGIRRPPVIPFLERKHFLNRHLGHLRHRVLKMLGKE